MCADLEGQWGVLQLKGCDQLMKILFRSTGGEVSGREHHQPSGFNQFGVSMLVVILLTSTWWGASNSSKILLRVSPEGNQDPCPNTLHYCFLTAPPWSLHPISSLVSNCLSLPLKLRESHRGWMDRIFVIKKWGDTERLLCLGSSTGTCLVSA